MEGIKLGELISSLPTITSSVVGQFDDPDAICASACVYAFLGADYRDLTYNGRIGVHKFYSQDGSLSSGDAMEMSQNLSASIAGYLRTRRVDSSFFDDIVSASANDINWVSKERLVEAGVLTQGVASETAEYRNIAGVLALVIEQIADVGQSKLLLMCGDQGLVGTSTLTMPELQFFGQMQIVVNGVYFEVSDEEILQIDGNLVKSIFSLPPDAAQAMIFSSEVGIRVIAPSGDIFYGFLDSVSDPKIAETVKNCATQKVGENSMERYNDIDIEGGDFDAKGLREISLSECEQVCLEISQCRAVSYILEKRWCWPKGYGGTVKHRLGIISSVRK